jgi:hypothetical protein
MGEFMPPQLQGGTGFSAMHPLDPILGQGVVLQTRIEGSLPDLRAGLVTVS